MRTKVLLCAAALAASLASSMAQSNVYSLNVVGYYNVTIGAHQKVMIANQLNTTNNTMVALLAPPMVGDGDFLYKYSGGFSTYQYSTDLGSWDPLDAIPTTLNPGEAAFFNPSAIRTLTFVGEVEQGSLTNTLPRGVKVMRSSIVPMAGQLTANFSVVPDDGDFAYTYNPDQLNSGYKTYQYSTDIGAWDPNDIPLSVGQGFFYVKALSANAAKTNWVQNFTVQ